MKIFFAILMSLVTINWAQAEEKPDLEKMPFAEALKDKSVDKVKITFNDFWMTEYTCTHSSNSWCPPKNQLCTVFGRGHTINYPTGLSNAGVNQGLRMNSALIDGVVPGPIVMKAVEPIDVKTHKVTKDPSVKAAFAASSVKFPNEGSRILGGAPFCYLFTDGEISKLPTNVIGQHNVYRFSQRQEQFYEIKDMGEKNLILHGEGLEHPEIQIYCFYYKSADTPECANEKDQWIQDPLAKLGTDWTHPTHKDASWQKCGEMPAITLEGLRSVFGGYMKLEIVKK